MQVSRCIVIDPATVPTSFEVGDAVIEELRIWPEDLRQIEVVTSSATMTKRMEMMLSPNKMNAKTYTAMN